MEAGEPHGLTPLGLEALDMVRIEAGLIFAGYEFDDQVDPFEAGIGFTVALDADGDFLGQEALVARKAHPQRKLVGLELEGNEPAAPRRLRARRPLPGRRDHVAACAARCSARTSRCAGWPSQHAEPGTEVEVGKLDGHQKRIPATVVPIPFYDPKKERPRS